jgi:putative transposase
MTRPLRIEYAGALYHVTSRGDRREEIYVDDGDRWAWLRLLGAVCRRFDWHVHAYCQMGNHYHLVVETMRANLSRGMRHLNGQYTQCFNHRHASVGHLFQGRYKAILVHREPYLLALSRYVVLNPVRAGLVRLPDEWRWSNYLMTVGAVQKPDWLEADWTLSQFASHRELAVHAYREFVLAGCGIASPLGNVRHQLLLGDDDFVRRRGLGGALLDETEITRRQKKGGVIGLSEYRSAYPKQNEAMARAYLSGAYSMSEIGNHFQVHYRTVSRAVLSFEQKCANVRPDPDKMSECQT